MCLLGRSVRGNKGVAWLHEQTGAPIVPAAVLRRRGGSEQLLLRPALATRPEPSARARITASVQAIYDELEAFVHAHPEQWCYWKFLHRM